MVLRFWTQRNNCDDSGDAIDSCDVDRWAYRCQPLPESVAQTIRRPSIGTERASSLEAGVRASDPFISTLLFTHYLLLSIWQLKQK